MQAPFKLMVLALEPSANLHLKPILSEFENIELSGIFDEKFGKPLLPSSDFNVMGFLDVIPKIFKAKKAINKLALYAKNVDHVLLIDSPAFNLPLAKAIKEKNPNIKITYYILPQVWAWKENRVKKIEKYCDNIASILPFEEKFYTKSVYVGHPLMDEISHFKNDYSKNGAVSFLPGSRKAEIKILMPIFNEIAQKIDEEKILVIPPFYSDEKIRELYGNTDRFKILRNTQDAMIKSKFAFICSGTATLEASLIGTPFVLVYKAKKIDEIIARIFVKLPYVGLANILRYFNNLPPMHKELLQEEVNCENLLNIYNNINNNEFFQNTLWIRQYLQFPSGKNLAKIIKV